jgi:arginase
VEGGDGGAVDVDISDLSRDAETGILAQAQIRDATSRIRDATRALLERGERPLILGGDCTVLLGAVAALDERSSDVALAFVDGHADFFDGLSSPTGETADMDLAVLVGHGARELVAAPARWPLVLPQNVSILGHRPSDTGPEVARENARVPSAIERLDARTIVRDGPREVGQRVARRLSRAANALWLHLDLDVLDASVFPAVTYPQFQGLSWEELEALVSPIASCACLAGVTVADFNPDLDPDGRHARRVVSFLGTVLSSRGQSRS